MKPRFGVYLSKRIAARLTMAAKRREITKSALVEAAIDRYLASEDASDAVMLAGRLADLSGQVAQGARLFGKYDSVLAFGQKRALVVWTRLILPNGNSIVIENLPVTDVAGYAGLEDEVDFHTWQLLKGIGLATLLGVGTQLSLGNDESDLVKALRESVQQTTNRAGQRLIERELDVQPTITVRPGWPLRVIVSKDLLLKPYQDIQTAAKAR